jgi:hypothetical protein
MDSIEARSRLQDLSAGGNVQPIRASQDGTRTLPFFLARPKTATMKSREWQHLHIYVEAVMRNGGEFNTCGIRLRDGSYLEPDKARLATALHDGVLEAVEGSDRILRFTEGGFQRYVQSLRAST